MSACNIFTKESLTNPIDIRVNDEKLDFNTAKILADQKAMEIASEPMLIGWYDSHSGKFSPDVECCSDRKPGWIVYAESRGANITIDINDEEYIFIYGDYSKKQHS